MMDTTEATTKVRQLLQLLGVNVIAICKGGPREDFVRPETAPSIIFKHSEESLKIFINILKNLGVNLNRLNEVLKSSFDKSTHELRWVFVMPSSLYDMSSESSRSKFWIQVIDSINNINIKS